MDFSLFFSKLKSLGPALFIVASIVITSKLLTTNCSSLQENLNVDAEEDIKAIAYEDEIEIPEPEPQQKEKEELEEQVQEDGEEEEEAREEESLPEQNTTPEEKDKQSEQKEKKSKTSPRRIRTDIPLGKVFKKLLSKEQK